MTRPIKGQPTSIIDFTFFTPELGALESWIIDEELVTPFDHELIIFNMTNMDETVDRMSTSQEVTGWPIKAMSEEETKVLLKAWQKRTGGRKTLGDSCSTEKVEE